MAKREDQPLVFDNIFDEVEYKEDPDKKPVDVEEKIPQTPPGGRTSADMLHNLDLGGELGKHLADLVKMFRPNENEQPVKQTDLKHK